VKLLILGGTRFLGRHLLDAALSRGHDVTLFNRGRNAEELPAGVEQLKGDRDGGLDALRGRRWDAVIDTCGYVPRVVRASAELLGDAVDHYTFVSSLSVYTDYGEPGLDEGAPVGSLDDTATEEVTGATYGPLKALCERAVEGAMPGRALSVRAGLIVGPRDDVARFTYWVRRVARGGEVLAPGRPDRAIQVIDARDLADWMVRMAEERQAGVYNATGPDRVLTMGEFLEEARRVSGSDARFAWAHDEFLKEQGVGAWQEMPLWLPEEGEAKNFFAIDCGKAFEAGLRFRPLAETIRDTLEWDAARGGERRPPRDYSVSLSEPGLTPEREAELLAALSSTKGHEGHEVESV
jgi:2'-hydroxyisoflavone reductase